VVWAHLSASWSYMSCQLSHSTAHVHCCLH
jgi:hypothetical protein